MPPEMYAVADVSGIYHDLEPSGKRTVCGLSVAQVVIPADVPSPLHLAEDVPETYRRCKNCEEQAGADVET